MVSNIPKAIGNRSSGSYCFLIAKYKRKNEIRSMTPCCQSIFINPMPWKKVKTSFHIIFLVFKSSKSSKGSKRLEQPKALRTAPLVR